jgi:hypothetical protein
MKATALALAVSQAYRRAKRAERRRIVRWLTKQRTVHPDPENVFGHLIAVLSGDELPDPRRKFVGPDDRGAAGRDPRRSSFLRHRRKDS